MHTHTHTLSPTRLKINILLGASFLTSLLMMTLDMESKCIKHILTHTHTHTLVLMFLKQADRFAGGGCFAFLQLQLKQAIRLGSPPSLMCVKRTEDAGTMSEDDGLPCSPPEYTAHHAVTVAHVSD